MDELEINPRIISVLKKGKSSGSSREIHPLSQVVVIGIFQVKLR